MSFAPSGPDELEGEERATLTLKNDEFRKLGGPLLAPREAKLVAVFQLVRPQTTLEDPLHLSAASG
jgi:hypothetical protein